MPIFEPGDVVRVPFPYVEVPVREMRPALIVSVAALGPRQDLYWTVMITSAANRGWRSDVSVEEDYKSYGLPVPSVIRTEKIAVIEAGEASRLGRVSDGILSEVRTRVAGHLGLAE